MPDDVFCLCIVVLAIVVVRHASPVRMLNACMYVNEEADLGGFCFCASSKRCTNSKCDVWVFQSFMTTLIHCQTPGASSSRIRNEPHINHRVPTYAKQ